MSIMENFTVFFFIQTKRIFDYLSSSFFKKKNITNYRQKRGNNNFWLSKFSKFSRISTTNCYIKHYNQWSIPIVNTSEVDPPNLIFHTATLFENYMIVAFGNFNYYFIYVYN